MLKPLGERVLGKKTVTAFARRGSSASNTGQLASLRRADAGCTTQHPREWTCQLPHCVYSSLCPQLQKAETGWMQRGPSEGRYEQAPSSWALKEAELTVRPRGLGAW